MYTYVYMYVFASESRLFNINIYFHNYYSIILYNTYNNATYFMRVVLLFDGIDRRIIVDAAN